MKDNPLDQDADMDMTPMIDCVFLLMIFFVLVIDLSQKDLEDLILPAAKYAVPDENPPEIRPIINIAQDGRMVYRKNEYFNPNTGDYDATNDKLTNDGKGKMDALLLDWKDIATDTEPFVNNVTLVNDPVLVRADKWTEWNWVGLFMTACSQSKDAAFWKLELALSEEDKEVKLYGKK